MVRSNREFLYQNLGEVIKPGATTLNILDTVGYNMPGEYSQLISGIKSNTQGIENVIILTRCQNDLGLSTINTIAVCHVEQPDFGIMMLTVTGAMVLRNSIESTTLTKVLTL